MEKASITAIAIASLIFFSLSSHGSEKEANIGACFQDSECNICKQECVEFFGQGASCDQRCSLECR